MANNSKFTGNDSSFDAFGGAGGWGENGEQDLNQSDAKRLGLYEKIPIPATISSLQQVNATEDKDKYKIGSFSFNTIKLFGKVTEVIEDGTTVKYTLIDPDEAEDSMSDTFTILRYTGAEVSEKEATLKVGETLQAVGKLRSYDNQNSLVCFHIRKVENMDEVALFHLEARLTIQYYMRGIPDKNVTELEKLGLTMFSALAPIRPDPLKPGQTPANMTPGRSRLLGKQEQHTPGHAGGATSRKAYNSPLVSHKSDISGQRNKIMEFIKIHGGSGAGVSVAEIKRACQVNDKLADDLNFLLGEGIIYNTIDDDHYSVIS